MHRPKVTILMVDDDEDDCLIVRTAFQESSLEHNLICFENGQEIIDYLNHCGKGKKSDEPRPNVILLDLNMPVKDGRTVLHEIKNDPDLKDIPVVVLTDSEDSADAIKCYELGASLFYTKSQWLEILAEIIRSSGEYWFDFAVKVVGTEINADGHKGRKTELENSPSSYLNPSLYLEDYLCA